MATKKMTELESLAREANRSADRSIRKLDETIAYVDKVLNEMKSRSQRRRISEEPKR